MMPSVEVAGKDWNSSERKDDQLTSTKLGKAEQPAKMPCSPYNVSTIPETTPPISGLDKYPHGNKNKLNVQNNVTAKKEEMEEATRDGEEQHHSVDARLPSHDPETSSGKPEGLKSAEVKQSQRAANTAPERPKPRSFSLLEFTYSKDNEGRGRSHLGKHRSINSSYEKETHKLTKTVSAPGELSDRKESPLEDKVFEEEEAKNEKKEGKTTEDQVDDAASIPSKEASQETKPQLQIEGKDISNKDTIRDDADVKKDKKPDGGKVGVCIKDHSEKKDTEAQADKVDSRKDEADKEISSDAGDQKKFGDIDSLTKDLQTNLRLDDIKKVDESKHKEGEVSALTGGIHSMTLKEKQKRHHLKIDPAGIIPATSTTAPGPTRLRAKGLLDNDVMVMQMPRGNLNTDTNYVNHGLYQSQYPSNSRYNGPASPWQVQTQSQSLPSFQIFKKARATSPGQPYQSVVSPPGHGNFPHIFKNPSGMPLRMVPVAPPQSKQIRFAQEKLYPQAQSENYPQNDLSGGGYSSPLRSPEESTGQPIENSWPLTPESIDDIIETITSDEEQIMSPMESMMDFIPSPQSPWQGSNSAASMASSVSPQHSPFTDPQASPSQLVPDTYPWTPESGVSSPGESLSPESPTFSIHCPGSMTTGLVTVSDRSSMSPHSPSKHELERRRIQEINIIKRELMSGSDPGHSQTTTSNCSFYQRQPHQDTCLPQPQTSVSSPVGPVRSSPTPIPTQQVPVQMYPSTGTLYIGEFETFKGMVEGYSVEELLVPDEDMDTVLHLAICHEKVPLSVAIIQRLWTEKTSLDILNKLQQTPLFLAIICKLHTVTEILINYGANLRIGNKDGNTPLHAATMKGNNEALKAIINGISYKGFSHQDTCALFDATNFDGKTPLMLAIEAHCESLNCAETVKLLLLNNANPMYPDCQSGKTALHYAVELQKMDLIFILLENCQDASKLVNTKMYNGNTALHLIVGRTIPEINILHIVGILMSKGANVSISNDANEKPCDLVRREHCEVKRHLHGQEHHKR